MLRRTELSIGYSGLLYGEANRCRLPFASNYRKNVFGGNGIMYQGYWQCSPDNSNKQGCFAIALTALALKLNSNN